MTLLIEALQAADGAASVKPLAARNREPAEVRNPGVAQDQQEAETGGAASPPGCTTTPGAFPPACQSRLRPSARSPGRRRR